MRGEKTLKMRFNTLCLILGSSAGYKGQFAVFRSSQAPSVDQGGTRGERTITLDGVL